ncbi:protoporphyrinogen/coproporphyrinogen oxidase [Paracoccus sp. (in: a-proteobacteria)]|uniref:protoporphyrinogen/coproporphyrinogen oxidase n=1 Tax=Paracoccus sp. TaxID=267 RepID=UPI003A89EF71
MNEQIHVIGAGITGLGAAHLIARHGGDSIVWEAAADPGGRAGYHMWQGECLEWGGKNYASDWRIFNSFITEFGLTERDRQHPNFHIVLNNRLIGLEKKTTLKSALRMLWNIGPVASIEFNRLMAEARRHAADLNYTDGLIEEVEAQYDGLPVSGLFHRNLANGPLRMFSIIMGGAEPEETYLSQIMLFLSSFGKGSHHSVPGGTKLVFDELSLGKDMRYGARLTRIEIVNNRLQALHFDEGGQSRVVPARQALVALPLNQLLPVLDLPDDVRAEAQLIRYFPLALINAIYDEPVFTPQMNSIMFDPGSILGHCSANRMYRPNHVRFTLSGRAARQVLHYPDEQLIDMAERDFARFQPIPGKREYFHVKRHMGGICAYAPNFTRIKRRLLDHIATIGGLEIAGDYLDGHNMEGCLTSAEKAVNRMLGRNDVETAA